MRPLPGIPRRSGRWGPGRPARAGAGLLVAVATGLLAGGACGGGGEPGPPEIRYGEDVCDLCGMIVSEERFAAATAVRGGDAERETFVFDDIGCLFAHEEELPGRPVLARYVHDGESGRWIPAESAFYIRSEEVRSPMGSGVLSFATREQARGALSRYPGEVRTYEELSELARQRGLIAPPRLGPRH